MDYRDRALKRPAQADDVRLLRGQLVLTDDVPLQSGKLVWTVKSTDGPAMYEPWHPRQEKPTLFHYFAKGVYDADDALVFFQNYGPLFDSGDWALEEGKPFAVVEPVDKWLAAASDARTALELLEGLNERDSARLAEILGRSGNPSADLSFARPLMYGLLNKNLQQNVHPVMTIEPATGRQGQLALEPSVLLGSMWLMFANEVLGDTVIRECEYCHTFMALSRDSARRGKRFCTDKCRNDSFRHKGGLGDG